MICEACKRKFFETSEQGIYSRYPKGEKNTCTKHMHLCKDCCVVVEKALKAVVVRGPKKHLPDDREFL